jgi:D-alanyl-D-alanine dipeptidase
VIGYKQTNLEIKLKSGNIYSNLLESRIVVAYVDSVMRTSGRHLSIHAALNNHDVSVVYWNKVANPSLASTDLTHQEFQ